MTLHELAQELLRADEANDAAAWADASAAFRVGVARRGGDRLLGAERRVALAGIRAIACRALFEGVDRVAPRYLAIASRLDDARVELAEALGMTHPADFTHFNPNQEVSNS